MLLQLAGLLAGFIALAWSADRFIAGAAATARGLGVPPLLIGLTIVGFGTSAPEMLVSAQAAWEGSTNLAIGNAIGSNIANIGLILGATALLVPLKVSSGVLRREIPILLGVMALTLLLMLDFELRRWEGVVLLTGLVALMAFLARQGLRRDAGEPLAEEFAEQIPADMALPLALTWLTVGLFGLLISSRLLVWSAVGIATALGVSELVIGLTIVALGTSLPELAASIASARKGEDDIAIGNVIGSNMFNLLGVIGIGAIIAPTTLELGILSRDFVLMTALTVGLLLPPRTPDGGRFIDRRRALVLLVVYVGYQLALYLIF